MGGVNPTSLVSEKNELKEFMITAGHPTQYKCWVSEKNELKDDPAVAAVQPADIDIRKE